MVRTKIIITSAITARRAMEKISTVRPLIKRFKRQRMPAVERSICRRGTYLSGTIHLASNIHLLIDMGATILAAPQDLNAYDEPEHWEGTAYQDGGHTYFRNSLIYGEGLTNVSITGAGDDQRQRAEFRAMVSRMLRMDIRTGSNPETARTNVTLARLGNKAIALKLCRNVVR